MLRLFVGKIIAEVSRETRVEPELKRLDRSLGDQLEQERCLISPIRGPPE